MESRLAEMVKELMEKYPESFDPSVPSDLGYSGSKSLTEDVGLKNSNLQISSP